MHLTYYPREGKTLAQREELKELGEKGGKESRFSSKDLLRNIKQVVRKKCIQRNNVSLPSYFNYKTARK